MTRVYDKIKFEISDGKIEAIGGDGKRYTIDLSAGTCGCPSFKFCPTSPRTCKHLKAARKIR